MGTVLHGDVKKDVLLPFLQNYIHQNYPKIFGFEEASKIYNALIKIDSQLNIIKLWFAFECDKYDKNLKSFLEEKLLDLTKGARVKDNAEIGLSEEKDNYCQ